MRFKLYTDMALAEDAPSARLCRGDVVRLVDYHVAPDGTEGYSVEVFNALGETVAVATLPQSALRPLSAEEILSVRPLAAVD